jgi:adenylate cyclase
VSIDFEAEGLLDGVTDEDARRARLELLRELEADGVPLEELRDAAERDRLAFLPAERALVGAGSRYTATEVAELTGLEYEFITRLWRALGVAQAEPDDPVYGEEDRRAAEAVAAIRRAGVSDDRILEVTRVLGESMSRLAAAIGSVFGTTYVRPGDTEREAALRLAEMSRELSPLMAPILEHALLVHQRQEARSAAAGWAETASGQLAEGVEVTVCFADLAGFTRLGEQVPPDELGAVAGRFTELAGVAAGGPVRLVKMIGDGAMLGSPKSAPVVAAALDLLDAVEAEGEDFPQLRVGLARGRALNRGGDLYGRPVNLASRVCSIARRGSVLATEEVKETADNGYSWSEAGLFKIKGISGRVPLFRVRRAEPGG